MKVKILADSACDLSEKHYNEFNIEMIPLTVHLDEKDYLDGQTISPKTVYDAMREGKVPKTSQPSLQVFKDVFTSYAEINQPCIYLSFSSELSGTYQTAKIAEQEIKEEYPESSIHVMDTKCASLGCGLIVLRAAKMANDGANVKDIWDMANFYASHMEHIFTVDNLEYLYRGGRVSRTAAFVGSLLKIKPVLHVDDGKLVPLEKIRGAKKLLNRMIEIAEQRGVHLENQVIGIVHGDDLERAEKLAELVKEKLHPKDLKIEMIGAAIGAHSGPGTLAVFCLNDEYN
ncbi:DegV family protein [Lentibacillus sp. L22]|uniref:DegV family protein n=1 Tax=Lentibacillus TaxID=175304 RepID=UPI0022B11CBF|nr:DegV family protein [Lentibacillus daqui]